MCRETNSNTIRETIICCKEEPELKGIWSFYFIELKHKRRLYEKLLEENERKLKEKIVATSYRSSLEDQDLRMFIAPG